jgi:hypothetical protein
MAAHAAGRIVAERIAVSRRKEDNISATDGTVSAGDAEQTHPAAMKWRRRGQVLLLALLIAACPLAVTRMATNRGSDFPEFHHAGKLALEGAPRERNPVLLYYLPSVDVAWGMLGVMPLWLAAIAWYCLSCVTFLGLLSAIRRHVLGRASYGEGLHRAPWVTVAAGLLVVPLAIDQFCLGGFHILMLWLVIAGMGRVLQGRWLGGGALLGLAVWLKLLPLLALAYLVWKRRFAAPLVALAAAIGVHAILSAATMGPHRAWESTRQWWQSSPSRVTSDLLGKPADVMEQRDNNQSLAAVLRRTLSGMGRDGHPPVASPSLASLAPPVLKGIYWGALGTLAAAGAMLARRHWRKTPLEQRGSELALTALATIWFSPVAWSYHFTAAAPAIAILLARAVSPWRWWLMSFTLTAWTLLLLLLGWRAACGLGQGLWLSLALGVAVVWTTPRQRAGPANAREPLRRPQRESVSLSHGQAPT